MVRLIFPCLPSFILKSLARFFKDDINFRASCCRSSGIKVEGMGAWLDGASGTLSPRARRVVSGTSLTAAVDVVGMDSLAGVGLGPPPRALPPRTPPRRAPPLISRVLAPLPLFFPLPLCGSSIGTSRSISSFSGSSSPISLGDCTTSFDGTPGPNEETDESLPPVAAVLSEDIGAIGGVEGVFSFKGSRLSCTAVEAEGGAFGSPSKRRSIAEADAEGAGGSSSVCRFVAEGDAAGMEGSPFERWSVAKGNAGGAGGAINSSSGRGPVAEGNAGAAGDSLFERWPVAEGDAGGATDSASNRGRVAK
jgi:hypothetical protein